jgi:putative oxidoreductase
MNDLSRNVFAPLVLRLGLAFFFLFQGMSKLGPDNGWGSGWHQGISMPGQIAIAWGQFLGGAALAIGFLTRLFALAMAGVLGGSVAAMHGVGGFDIRNQNVGFEYTACLLVVCLALALLGGGLLGLDTWLWRRRPTAPEGRRR